jgi:hypothetical protein
VTVARIDDAAGLPDGWDALASSPFQRRAFLAHAECRNPCRQRYYTLSRGGRVVAGCCCYTLRLDLLTFARLPSPVRVQFLGVPCSCSAPGVIGDASDAAALVAEVCRIERGLLVGLNLDAPVGPPAAATGRTLPAVVLDLPFASFDAYRAAMRSDYRRRLDRTLAAWDGVAHERLPCAAYDDAMHAQYLDVWRRSDAKLERLDAAFLRDLPGGFNLTAHRRDGRLLGWHATVTDGASRAFFLGGVDRETNREGGQAKTGALNYFNLLASVVREAIEDGVRSLDLGQTAEVPKTRLGGRLVEKGMFGWHRSRLVRALLRRFKGVLEYPRRVPDAHVFRVEAAA